jgi:hypothetical protein
VNVAVTLRAALMMRVHELVPQQSPPPQPENVAPLPACAVNVTIVPLE